ncbi:MAG: GNAT family N-acetyltransferase [Gemmatimonadaceae bacterium]
MLTPLPADRGDSGLSVLEARGAADVDAFRALVREHAAALASTLPADAIDRILLDADALPGLYASPSGSIVLAWVDSNGETSTHQPTAIGGGAMHALDTEVAEIKRMFVRPSHRRDGVGGRILAALINAARARGYRRVRLGTRPEMHAAVALYRRYGFVPIAPYRVHDLSPDTLFFERTLG